MRTVSGIHIAAVIYLAVFIICLPVSGYSGAADGLVTEGNSLLQTKNYTQAIAAFDQAISLVPDNVEAWNGKADALNRDQRFSDALAASDKTLALNPDYVQGWINRGYILYNLGRYDDELKAYETAISLDPTNADAWFNKGYALAGMKRYDEAIAAFDQVGKLNPDYPNLAANRRIAVQSRDASTPVYLRYAWVILGVLALFGIMIAYIVIRKKTRDKRTVSDTDKKMIRGKGMRKEKK